MRKAFASGVQVLLLPGVLCVCVGVCVVVVNRQIGVVRT